MQDTNPLLCVSTAVVLFTVQRTLKLLLVQDRPWRLPTATLDANETLEGCAKRALAEAAGVEDVFLEQLYTFNEFGGGVPAVVVSYYALIPYDRVNVRPGSGEWVDSAPHPAVADGQQRIVTCACERLAAKLEYAPIAYQFLADQFTLGELQSVYEIIGRQPLDKRNFRRRIRASEHLLETRDSRRGESHRPAKLYRVRNIRPSV
ncbi:MAG: NUDIX hydrolase [Acidiferrobacter sp.]